MEIYLSLRRELVLAMVVSVAVLSSVVFLKIVSRVNAGAQRYTLHVLGGQAPALLALFPKHKKRSPRASEQSKGELSWQRCLIRKALIFYREVPMHSVRRPLVWAFIADDREQQRCQRLSAGPPQ